MINRDPSFDIYGMAELYMYMQEILDIPSKHETLGQRRFTVWPKRRRWANSKPMLGHRLMFAG